jgi:hypothetical protein
MVGKNTWGTLTLPVSLAKLKHKKDKLLHIYSEIRLNFQNFQLYFLSVVGLNIRCTHLITFVAFLRCGTVQYVGFVYSNLAVI